MLLLGEECRGALYGPYQHRGVRRVTGSRHRYHGTHSSCSRRGACRLLRGHPLHAALLLRRQRLVLQLELLGGLQR